MPLYTYKCEKCDYQFDQFQHFADDPLTVCPNCDAPALRKVYQPVGIVFKGKGFYATDHRSPSGQSNNHKNEAAGEAKAASAAAEASSASVATAKKTTPQPAE